MNYKNAKGCLSLGADADPVAMVRKLRDGEDCDALKSEISRLQLELQQEREKHKLSEQRVEVAGNLLESMSAWFYKRSGMEEPSWAEQYKSVCQLFEPPDGIS